MSQGGFYLFKTPESVDQLGPGMLAFLKRIVQESGPQYVKHATYKDPRSLSQNDMFHGLCNEIASHWNAHMPEKTSAEAVKRDLKIQYGVVISEYSPVSGKRGARLKSTGEYTKQEMGDLITNTLAWAAGEGIPLRDPRVG
jgi:hypothetical protein